MSGSEAAPGACPAPADWMATRAVAASNAVKIEMRFMSSLLAWVPRMSTVGRRINRFRGGQLVRRRHRPREGLAERQPHRGDLLLLGDDDLLGNALELLVVAVAQFRLRHLDRPLMMRGHHRNEVSIDIPRRSNTHLDHHLRHRTDVLGQIW